MHSDSIPQPVAKLIWRQTKDGLVIVDPNAGKVRVLNPVAASIWEQICASKSLDEIRANIVATFDVSDEQASADLNAFVTDLDQRGLLEWSPEAPV